RPVDRRPSRAPRPPPAAAHRRRGAGGPRRHRAPCDRPRGPGVRRRRAVASGARLAGGGHRAARGRPSGRPARSRIDLVRAQGRGMGAGSMTEVLVGVLIVVLLLVATVAGASVRILREYERGVVFRLGRLLPQRGPGLVYLIPFVDRLVRVSLRTVTLRVPAQDVITRDTVPARVTAVTCFRVVDPTNP